MILLCLILGLSLHPLPETSWFSPPGPLTNSLLIGCRERKVGGASVPETTILGILTLYDIIHIKDRKTCVKLSVQSCLQRLYSDLVIKNFVHV